jgi:uncharacterized protein involved in outer membrane biogenesis
MSRRRAWALGIAGFALLPAMFVLALHLGWLAPWLTSWVARVASTSLGRPVDIQSLTLRAGWTTRVTLSGITVANPPGFPEEPPFARIASVDLALDSWASLRDRAPRITALTLTGAAVEAITRADGSSNHDLGGTGERTVPLGVLELRDARIHIVHAPLDADFTLTAVTTTDGASRLRAEAAGHYAGAPITARLEGGSLVALAHATHPWPVTLEVVNGTTRALLRGALVNGLELGAADLRLELSGPDMRFLRPLTGVPIPSTPPFHLAGRLGYGEEGFRFTEMQGRMGRSDLGGSVTVDPRGAVPQVTAELVSRQLDLADLAGFIGGEPGRGVPIRPDTPRTGRVLPDAPVNLPLFRAADVKAHLRAARIIGPDSPFDSLDVALELQGGVLTLKPLRGGVGRGAALVTGTLAPNEAGAVQAALDVTLQGLDISRLMRALGGSGGGALEGRGRIEAKGRSTAELLARGNGGLGLRMAGGDLRAVAVDLAGLRLGNAVFSAFGLPMRTALECFAADFVLREGVLYTRLMLLETSDALLHGTGTIRLDRETLDLRLRSEAKRFTVGSLPTSLAVTGRLSDPSVAPVIVQDRGGEGLGRVLDLALAPLSLLPIIEFGIGEDPRCENAIARTRARPERSRR